MEEKPEFKSFKELLLFILADCYLWIKFYCKEHTFKPSTFVGILGFWLYYTNSQFRINMDILLGSAATVQGLFAYLIGKKG